jgi:GntR family transcriptional repressor for pyruvate dehydrogenase complex
MNPARYRTLPLPDEETADTHHIRIVDSIRTMIRDGLLREGDPLPSERELAEKFNVSRVPVREAIKILEFIGVLHRVRSRGLFVKHVDLRQTMNQFHFVFVNTPAALDELFEVRQAIEIQAVRAAAERRTAEDLLLIEEQWVLCDHLIRTDRDPAVPATDFHFAIARATRNSVLVSIFDFLLDLHIFASRNLYRTSRLPVAHAEHRRIFESIRDQDPEAAEMIMREHLQHSRRAAHAFTFGNETGHERGADAEQAPDGLAPEGKG